MTTPVEEARDQYDTETCLRHAREFLALVTLVSNAFAAVHFAEADLGGSEPGLEAQAYEALKRLSQDAWVDLGAVQDGVTFKDVLRDATIDSARSQNAAHVHVLPTAEQKPARKHKAGAR